MRLLQKTWFRIVLSFLGSGVVTEAIHVSTGDPNRPMAKGSAMLGLFYPLIIYVILTALLRKSGKI